MTKMHWNKLEARIHECQQTFNHLNCSSSPHWRSPRSILNPSVSSWIIWEPNGRNLNKARIVNSSILSLVDPNGALQPVTLNCTRSTWHECEWFIVHEYLDVCFRKIKLPVMFGCVDHTRCGWCRAEEAGHPKRFAPVSSTDLTSCS